MCRTRIYEALSLPKYRPDNATVDFKMFRRNIAQKKLNRKKVLTKNVNCIAQYNTRQIDHTGENRVRNRNDSLSMYECQTKTGKH